MIVDVARPAEFYAQLLDLHRRRLAGDPTVISDIARLSFQHLFEALRRQFPLQQYPTLDDAVLYEKAGEAILAYGHAPEKANAVKGAGVFNYLELRARSRVANYRRDEATRARYEAAFARGERAGGSTSPEARSGNSPKPRGHTLERNPVELRRRAVEQGKTDAIDELDDAEERARRWDAATREITNPQDRAILELMRAGERRTERFAEVLGIVDLPNAQQRSVVKQRKDRIKAALRRTQAVKRAGGRRPRGRPRRTDPRGTAGDSK